MSKTLAEDNHKSDDKKCLKKLLKEVLFFKETTLASGKKSHYYIDARLVTLSWKGSLPIARVLLDLLADYNIKAIGGLTMGADPIVSAITVLSNLEEIDINAFIVRKEIKQHGKQQKIEGPPIKGLNVAIVDDVVTSGSSLLKAAQAATEAGANVKITTALVDRMEGAQELLKQANFNFKPIFTIKELL